MAIPKKEPRPEKVQEVANLKELLNYGTVILTDYHGLDVKSISALRRKLRAAGSGPSWTATHYRPALRMW